LILAKRQRELERKEEKIKKSAEGTGDFIIDFGGPCTHAVNSRQGVTAIVRFGFSLFCCLVLPGGGCCPLGGDRFGEDVRT
jgi:hypothetical protein